MSSSTITADEISKAWSFENAAVAAKFDAHVREQLPWYEACSRYVADLSVSFIPKNGVVYDIGASTGNITKLLREPLEAKNATAISIEPSKEMARLWAGYGSLQAIAAEDYNFNEQRPDLIVMMLVLMFMPTSTRTLFMSHLFDALNPGGAIILVDKGFITLPCAQVASKAATCAEKARSGMKSDAYIAKELSLRGEQRPTDMSLLIYLAEEHGLKSQEIFRHGEFYGVILVKPAI